MPPKSQSQSRSQSQSQSRSQPQAQSQRQTLYHGARSTSFGEIQDPIRWMTRTPVSVFPSRQSQSQRTPSPYPTGVTAARGYLPPCPHPHQLLGGRPQANRSPPVPLYRRFPTPRFTSSTTPIPSLRSDTSRPYSATTYRLQRASAIDDRYNVVLPPRPATSSEVDSVVPHQRQPRIVLKNYRQVSKPLELTKASTETQALQEKPKASPASSIQRGITQAPGTKQEEDDGDETVTGSSDNSDDELALDLAPSVSTPKKPVASLLARAAKQNSTIENDTLKKHLALNDDNQRQKQTAECTALQKRPYAHASTQASENWLVSSATQTVFEEVVSASNPKRQKTSAVQTVAAVIEQAHGMLREKVHLLSQLDEIVAINQDVGEMVADRLQTGDAAVLEELDALMLVKMVADDEDMYGRVEKMLAMA